MFYYFKNNIIFINKILIQFQYNTFFKKYFTSIFIKNNKKSLTKLKKKSSSILNIFMSSYQLKYFSFVVKFNFWFFQIYYNFILNSFNN